MLRLEAGRHYAAKFLGCRRVICRGTVLPEEWAKVRKALYRESASFVKFNAGDAAPIYSTSRIPFPSVGFGSAQEAVRAFGRDIAALRLRVEPKPGKPALTASKDWAPVRQPRESAWERVGELRVSDPNSLREWLMPHNIVPMMREHGKLWIATWAWPASWDAERRCVVMASLRRCFGSAVEGEETPPAGE